MELFSPNYYAIVPAAGIGERMHSDTPKQYLPIKGKSMIEQKPIIEHTLTTLLASPILKYIVVVLHKEDQYWHKRGLQDRLEYNNPRLIVLYGGGAERYNSVYSGLLHLQGIAQADDWVLVHDAVRPYLQLSDLAKLIEQLNQHPVGGLLGAPVHDTIKQLDDQQAIVATSPRCSLWRAFTPQMFRYQLLCRAYRYILDNEKSVTDDASAVELLGATESLGAAPQLVLGRCDNIKITDPIDLDFASLLLSKAPELQKVFESHDLPAVSLSSSSD